MKVLICANRLWTSVEELPAVKPVGGLHSCFTWGGTAAWAIDAVCALLVQGSGSGHKLLEGDGTYRQVGPSGGGGGGDPA